MSHSHQENVFDFEKNKIQRKIKKISQETEEIISKVFEGKERSILLPFLKKKDKIQKKWSMIVGYIPHDFDYITENF